MMRRAEVTAFLSLIFILLLSFIGAMIESASIQLAKNYRRADVNRAMESVFAEYQKALLDEYELFGLEGSYETGSYSEALLTDRLAYYGASSMDHTISRIQFLTDGGGEVFLEQVAACMENRYGLDAFQDQVGQSDTWLKQAEDAETFEQTDQDTMEELDEILAENEAELPEADNPISHVSDLKKKPLLSLVLPAGREVSEKQVTLSSLVSHRNLRHGYGDFSDQSVKMGTLEELLFNQYLLDHFQGASTEDNGRTLAYELEYLIMGKDSDQENLEAVVHRLLLIRFVPNYLYLQTSAVKKEEVRSAAEALCVALPVPGISEVVTQAVLLAWAYGESLMDLRALLKQNRVPLVKSDDSWQLSLSGLLKLGEGDDLSDGQDVKGGLSYEDYLRMLLFLTDKEDLRMRALDLIELNLRFTNGLDFFRADQCVTKMEISTECAFRRGITYSFSTYFGYH